MGSWSLKPFVISLFAVSGFSSQMKQSVKLQRKWSCSRNRRWWRVLPLTEQQLYSLQTWVELLKLAWRLVVAKHLRAKVLLFFPRSFVFLCLSPSAQLWWLLLLTLSASFFLVVFSPNQPLLLLPETLNSSLPVHQSIFHQGDLTHIYSYAVAPGSTLNKVKMRWGLKIVRTPVCCPASDFSAGIRITDLLCFWNSDFHTSIFLLSNQVDKKC